MNTPIRQTAALFLDAYRELNARKLFWITLLLSAAVVGAFAAVGLNERGITFLWWTFPSRFNAKMIEPHLLYKFAFAKFAIPLWLAWAATILALVSTASLIPDFVQGGAIELAVSKPIGRGRLILTKFVTGLTFAALQVAVFTFACFLVIGIRGNSWEPRIFLAVPIMVLFFSYLYSVSTLLGLLTRSTIAALLLTLMFWFLIFGIHTTEGAFLYYRENTGLRIERLEARIESLRAREARQAEAVASAPAATQAEETPAEHALKEQSPAAPATQEAPPPDLRAAGAELALAETRRQLTLRETQLERSRDSYEDFSLGQRISFAVKTFLPKTSETVGLLDRYLLSEQELESFRAPAPTPAATPDGEVPVSDSEIGKRIEKVLRGRTMFWIIGTSLAFEAAILLLTVRIFRRRDF